MIRGFFRLVGLLLLAGGFIFVVYDGARWVADQNLRFTRFGQFWNDINQSSQQQQSHQSEKTADHGSPTIKRRVSQYREVSGNSTSSVTYQPS